MAQKRDKVIVFFQLFKNFNNESLADEKGKQRKQPGTNQQIVSLKHVSNFEASPAKV